MDASAKRYGGGHRLLRHNLDTAMFMKNYYGRLNQPLGNQAFLEVMTHIAFDAGIIRLSDVRLMSEYTRVLLKKSGPRTMLGSPHSDSLR